MDNKPFKMPCAEPMMNTDKAFEADPASIMHPPVLPTPPVKADPKPFRLK
jgi:hypothetical protein